MYRTRENEAWRNSKIQTAESIVVATVNDPCIMANEKMKNGRNIINKPNKEVNILLNTSR
jgi:hypothetical protein